MGDRINLGDIFENIILEKRIKYDMRNINGGFSDGVDIDLGKAPGIVSVAVNIYGGGSLNAVKFSTPQKVSEFQTALVAARQNGDPVGSQLTPELNDYKNQIRKAVARGIVALMQKFDAEAKSVVENAVAQVNKTYTGNPHVDSALKEPKPAPKAAPAPVKQQAPAPAPVQTQKARVGTVAKHAPVQTQVQQKTRNG